jgi:O-antigen ligase
MRRNAACGLFTKPSIVIEIGFAAWLLLTVRDVSARPRRSILLWAFIGFLVVIGIADICGVNPWKSFWSNFERMEGYITLLHLFFYFLIAGTLFSERLWERYWICSVGASVLMSLCGVFQLVMMHYPVLQRFGLIRVPQSYGRIDATFDNSAYLAIYLIFNIFFAVLLCVRKGNGLHRLLSGFAMVLNMVVLYCTATRGAILGFLGGFLLFLALMDMTGRQRSWKKKISPYVFVTAGVVAAVFIAFRNTAVVKNSPVLSRFANISWSNGDGRQFIWPIALQAIADHPVLGWGQEGFNDAFSAHYDLRFTSGWADRAHNIILDWLVSGGILGLLAYLSLFAASLRLLWKKISNVSHTEKALFSGLLAVYFFHNLFTFDTVVSYTYFMSVLGFINFKSTRGGQQHIQTDMKEARVGDAGAFDTAVVVGLAFFLYAFNWTAFQTGWSLIDAQRAVAAGNPLRALSDFEQALSHNLSLGREEVVERLVDAAPKMSASSVPPDIRYAFFEIAKKAVENQVARAPEYLRYEVIASRFYAVSGDKAEEEKYLRKAAEILAKR